VRPIRPETCRATVWLSDPVVQRVAVGDGPVAMALSRPGQTARLLFDASAGEALEVRATEPAFATTGGEEVRSYFIYVLNPDGTERARNNTAGGGDLTRAFTTAVAGQHTFLLTPGSSVTQGAAATGTVRMQVAAQG
jgi:hypothetical protein